MPHKICRLLMVSFLVALSLGLSEAQATEAAPAPSTTPPLPMIAAGSGVNLAITQKLAAAFMASHPPAALTVPPSIGTKGAISAIKDNAITFGLISRPLKESEKSAQTTELAYAQTPIVVGAGGFVTDTNLSFEELVAIYKGTKTQWSDGHEIIVQSREAFDSGFSILAEKVPGFQQTWENSLKNKQWAVSFNDQDANKAIATTPYALGVTDLGMVLSEGLSIKPLGLNGTQPSLEALQNGTYPLARTLFFLYRPKDLPPLGQAFLDFVRSPEGAEILKANGYLPL